MVPSFEIFVDLFSEFYISVKRNLQKVYHKIVEKDFLAVDHSLNNATDLNVE